MTTAVHLFWFRRDLRLDDNKALTEALASGIPVVPLFIFDKTILEQFPDPYDRRVDYIHQAVALLNHQLASYGSALTVLYDTPLRAFETLLTDYNVQTVFCNHDYEPQAIQRDLEIKTLLQTKGVGFQSFKDQVIFEKDEVLKSDGTPYTVFTPYSKQWKKQLSTTDYDSLKPNTAHFYPLTTTLPSLEALGFVKTDLVFEVPTLNEALISTYAANRDYPSLDQTSRLGIALRFGTISIRKCVAAALVHSETWLNELIWREFFMQILFHFPAVVTQCFKPKYEAIQWRNNESEFEKWCKGETGYPMVDAGMRELLATGFMHNRVRMVVASFLTKHLLIDWRWGEAYFAQKLLDYDLAANNGNWQWAAGCGCDAAPYFRIFNPSEQLKKFDKDLAYVKKWHPDYEDSFQFPEIVAHKFARERALETYKKGLASI